MSLDLSEGRGSSFSSEDSAAPASKPRAASLDTRLEVGWRLSAPVVAVQLPRLILVSRLKRRLILGSGELPRWTGHKFSHVPRLSSQRETSCWTGEQEQIYYYVPPLLKRTSLELFTFPQQVRSPNTLSVEEELPSAPRLHSPVSPVRGISYPPLRYSPPSLFLLISQKRLNTRRIVRRFFFLHFINIMFHSCSAPF